MRLSLIVAHVLNMQSRNLGFAKGARIALDWRERARETVLCPPEGGQGQDEDGHEGKNSATQKQA